MSYSTESMIAVVQMYIHIRKDIQVNIKINNFADIRLLSKAHKVARQWMQNNNFRIYGQT